MEILCHDLFCVCWWFFCKWICDSSISQKRIVNYKICMCLLFLYQKLMAIIFHMKILKKKKINYLLCFWKMEREKINLCSYNFLLEIFIGYQFNCSDGRWMTKRISKVGKFRSWVNMKITLLGSIYVNET